MSITTTIYLFTEARHTKSVHCVSKLVECIGSVREPIYLYEHRSIFAEACFVRNIDAYSPQTVIDAAQEKKSLILNIKKWPPFKYAALGDQIDSTIPTAVRGTCSVGFGVIGVGYMPIVIDDGRTEEPQLIGISEMCVMLPGHSTPTDCYQYEKLIWEVPAVQELQRDVEAILGPVKRAVVYSV